MQNIQKTLVIKPKTPVTIRKQLSNYKILIISFSW